MRDIEFLKTKLIAHRGIHDNKIKENTLLSFKNAIKKGNPIEIDIQLTKDNKIIVFHDKDLKRMLNIKKQIKDLNYKDLLKESNYHIPLFKEVLELVNGKVPLLIEIKPYSNSHILEEKSTELLDNYKGKFAIQSFSPMIIYWFKKHKPDYIRGQLMTNNYNYNFIANIVYRHMVFNFFTKPDFISYNIKGLPNKIIEKQRKKRLILGWTIREKKDLSKYKDYCDNFIVENVI